MSLLNRTEEREKFYKQVEDAQRVLQQQIVGVNDSRRSIEYWKNILKDFSVEAIAEALSSELTHFNYRQVSRRVCCCRCADS